MNWPPAEVAAEAKRIADGQAATERRRIRAELERRRIELEALDNPRGLGAATHSATSLAASLDATCRRTQPLTKN